MRSLKESHLSNQVGFLFYIKQKARCIGLIQRACFLFRTQFCKNCCQDGIAFVKLSNSGHDLVVSGITACVSQLVGQIGQFLGMGSIVAGHVLHQRQELIQRRMGMFMFMLMVMMMVMMLMAVFMEMIMGMRMLVAMGVCMGMLMGMGMAVVGMLMGMSVVVHSIFSLMNYSVTSSASTNRFVT